MKMTKDRVITDDAKFNFFSMIQKLGHPDIGLNKLLGFNIYEYFLTKKSLMNAETQCLILYLLDFGRKCNLTEAEALYQHLLEYCRKRLSWEADFRSKKVDDQIISMERDWTWKFINVVHNLQNAKTDLNFRLKHLLTELNKVSNVIML